MRIVQFESKKSGRRLGVVTGDVVCDITAKEPSLPRLYDAFAAAQEKNLRLADFLAPLVDASSTTLNYETLLASRSLDDGAVLRPPLDHEDHHRVLVAGTGLTHLGGMKSRDQMHSDADAAEEDEASKSDSKKMFELGLKGGKPNSGVRGAAPEWFFKGNGSVLRGHQDTLQIPPFALDGGEEPEIVGCYVIDTSGTPRRLGFALGNEWADHATERINYLYLAPSKLRQCAVGPELITDEEFQHIELRCTVTRAGKLVYDSGPLLSGEEHMCHSLANCEDHHFKYPSHRVPGDVHLHFFGTSKLSHSERDWKFDDGDEIRVESAAFGGALVTRASGSPNGDPTPIRAELA